MKSKKIIAALAIILTGTALLAGCTGGKKNEASSEGKTTIRISWWGGDDRHKATLAAIKAFEKENPAIKVKAEYSGFDGFGQKLTTQIAGNTEPDVMQINYDWLALHSPTGDGFYDLNKLDNLDLSGYEKDILASGAVDGKQNAVPFSENAWVLDANKTAYDKRGAEVPTTWDGFVEAAKKFEEGSYPTRITLNDMFIYLQQKTGKPFLDEDGKILYDQKTLEEGLTWYKDMIDKKVTPPPTELKEQADANPGAPSKKFLDGQYGGNGLWIAMISSDFNTLKEAGQEIVLPSYPKITEDGKAAVITKPSMMFAISKSTKHPKEAAKLLDFMLNNPEGVKAMGVNRGLPSNQKAFDILNEDGQIDGIMLDAMDFMKDTDGIIESKYFEMSQISTVLNTNMESFGFGKQSASKTAKEMISGTEKAIEQIKSTVRK